LAGQQPGTVKCLAGQDLHHFLPVVRGQDIDTDGHLIRFRPGTLHTSRHLAALHLDRQHLPASRVGSAATKPGADVEALQHGDPALGPPALAELAALVLGLDAPFGLARPGTGEKVTIVIPHGYSPTASCRKAKRSLICSLDSSVSQASPVPRTCA